MARQITIVLEADTGTYTSRVDEVIRKNQSLSRDAIEGAQRASEAWSRWQANVVTLNQALELAQKAIGPIVSGIQQLVQAASEQEQATNALNAAFQITGRQIPIDRMTAFATQLQNTTRFNDEAILKVTTLLAQLTDLDEKGLQRATRGAIGLAAVMDKDLNAAALQVARAMTGNAESLKRVGISIDSTLPVHKQQEQVLQRLAPLFNRA